LRGGWPFFPFTGRFFLTRRRRPFFLTPSSSGLFFFFPPPWSLARLGVRSSLKFGPFQTPVILVLPRSFSFFPPLAEFSLPSFSLPANAFVSFSFPFYSQRRLLPRMSTSNLPFLLPRPGEWEGLPPPHKKRSLFFFGSPILPTAELWICGPALSSFLFPLTALRVLLPFFSFLGAAPSAWRKGKPPSPKCEVAPLLFSFPRGLRNLFSFLVCFVFFCCFFFTELEKPCFLFCIPLTRLNLLSLFRAPAGFFPFHDGLEPSLFFFLFLFHISVFFSSTARFSRS